MRTLLLTHAYFLADDEREREIMRPYPPLGILSIAAWMRRHEIDVELFDATFSNRPALEAHLLTSRPQVVGIYTNLMTRRTVISLIAWIRSRPELDQTRIVLGGPEVRHHAEKLLERGADVIVIGEGEETMRELIESLPWNEEKLREIEGVVFRGMDGAVIATPERRLLKQLDELPSPARDLIDMGAYLQVWRRHHGASAVSISTMRGCPFSCRWCSRAVYGSTYRRRSPRVVVDEIEEILGRYAPDSLWFVDDVFTINPRWMEEFAAELAARQLAIRYECITRADRLNDRMIELLRASGCMRVWIGAESGSQRILDAMDRRVTVEQVRSTIRESRAAGIETGTFIMLGYPGEREEDILATIEHLKEALPDHFTVTVAYPITGTPYHTEVRDDLVDPLPWEESSDRNLRHPRPFSDRYYRFAIRRMVHEVELERHRCGGTLISAAALQHGLKAIGARLGMRWSRGITPSNRAL